MRLVAYVAIPHFAVEVERLEQPGLRGRPVVLGGSPDERKVVEDCSAEAEARGVRMGQPLRQALSLCHEAIFLAPRRALYLQLFEAVVAALEQVSPVVEAVALGSAYLELTGLERHHGGGQGLAQAIAAAVATACSLAPSIGLASGRFPARLAAAAQAGRAAVLEPAQVTGFLAGQPVEALPAPPDVHRRLRLLGLHTLGQLTRLPLGAVQAEFGSLGGRLWRLAHGQDDEPVLPRRLPQVVRQGLSFPSPAVTVDALLVAVEELLAQAFEQPLLHGRAARYLALRLTLSEGRLWERRVSLREASASRRQLLLVLRSSLEGLTLPGPVEELEIEIGGLCADPGKQGELFGHKRAGSGLAEAARQLKAQLGYAPILKIVEVEPWSRIPERRRALIDYDP